jgi:hypothetical protein
MVVNTRSQRAADSAQNGHGIADCRSTSTRTRP